jgi:hypothetical protein
MPRLAPLALTLAVPAALRAGRRTDHPPPPLAGGWSTPSVGAGGTARAPSGPWTRRAGPYAGAPRSGHLELGDLPGQLVPFQRDNGRIRCRGRLLRCDRHCLQRSDSCGSLATAEDDAVTQGPCHRLVPYHVERDPEPVKQALSLSPE